MDDAAHRPEVETIIADIRRLAAGSGALPAPVPGEPMGAASIYRARRDRDRIFGKHAALFADPAWDMLLDLYAAAEDGRQISVSSVCIAAAVPATTGLRHLGALTAHGLVDVTADPLDGRRRWVSLSAQGAHLLGSWLAGLRFGS